MVLAGASETHNTGKMAFQEADQVSYVAPHAKLAQRPPYPHLIPQFIKDAYRTAMFGRPGPTYVDLPADLILGTYDLEKQTLPRLPEPPRSTAPEDKIRDIVNAFKQAKSPLVVIGKGAAYARAERQIQTLIQR